jgi:enoyl-CoA hydratase
LNDATISELSQAFAQLRDDAAVGAIILTGAGDRGFVAGADIRELATYNAEQAMACARKGQALCDLIEKLGKPVIAAINGLALGGGCEIAMACTVRIASAAAKLGQPEVKLGVIPGYGGSQRLPRLIGRGRAMEMILGGEPISAETAAQWGLVNRVVPAEQLLACALELAGKIVANSSSAVALAMQAVNEGLDSPLAQGLILEASLFGLSFSTADMREGTQAFLEKRPAQFGRR